MLWLTICKSYSFRSHSSLISPKTQRSLVKLFPPLVVLKYLMSFFWTSSFSINLILLRNFLFLPLSRFPFSSLGIIQIFSNFITSPKKKKDNVKELTFLGRLFILLGCFSHSSYLSSSKFHFIWIIRFFLWGTFLVPLLKSIISLSSCPTLFWLLYVCNMKYPDSYFNIAIDKSTIDAILCGMEQCFLERGQND